MSGRPRGSLRLVHKGVEVTGTFSPVVSYALSHGGAGIVGPLTARNTSKRRSSAFTIALSLEPYGAPCSLEVRPLSAGSEQLLDCPALVLDAKPLTHLQLPRPAGLVLGVSGKPESNTRYESQVLGQWDWVVDTSTESLKALAAFVSRGNPHVEQVALWAQEMLPAEAGGQTFRELLKGVAPECPEREILRCLYRYLAERCHIGYEAATARTVSGTEVVYQRIRRPQEVLQGWNGVIWGWGTCIDLAVLMAGCLEKARMAPVLVLTSGNESSVPDHAFVGCWKGHHRERPIIRNADDLARFRLEVKRGNAWVVECTGVTKGAHRTRLSFEEAVASATEQLSRDRVWIVDVAALRPPEAAGVSGAKDWVMPMDLPAEREGGMARLQKVLAPLDFLTEASRHTHTFTGRRWLFEHLESWLQGGGASRIFWLTGGPGVGKSAVAMAFLQRRDVVASHFCAHGITDKCDAKRMVLSLAYQLATHLDDYRRHLEALNLEEETLKDAPTLFENLIVQPLRMCADPGHPLLVVVDGVDEATGTDGNAIARLIGSQWNHTPDWLKLVITSRPEGAVQMPLQGLRGLNPVILHAESPENLEDLRGFITGELRAPGHEPDRRMVDVLLEKSEGMFLYAVLVLEDVRDKALSLEDADSLPKGLYRYYDQFFHRQFPEVAAYEQEVRPLLEVIVAQRAPLPLALLARATGTTVNKLAPRFLKLGSLFPRQTVGAEQEAATIQPFHKSVVDWLTGLDETYLPIAGTYAVVLENGQAALTKACWEDCQQENMQLVTEYTLSTLHHHLEDAQDYDRLWILLNSEKFRSAQVERTASYNWALASMRIGLSLYARRNDGKMDGRLCALALRAGELGQQAATDIQQAFEWFQQSPGSLDKALKRLGLLDEHSFYLAAVILLWIEADRCAPSSLRQDSHLYANGILDAIEARIPAANNVVRWNELLSPDFMGFIAANLVCAFPSLDFSSLFLRNDANNNELAAWGKACAHHAATNTTGAVISALLRLTDQVILHKVDPHTLESATAVRKTLVDSGRDIAVRENLSELLNRLSESDDEMSHMATLSVVGGTITEVGIRDDVLFARLIAELQKVGDRASRDYMMDAISVTLAQQENLDLLLFLARETRNAKPVMRAIKACILEMSSRRGEHEVLAAVDKIDDLDTKMDALGLLVVNLSKHGHFEGALRIAAERKDEIGLGDVVVSVIENMGNARVQDLVLWEQVFRLAMQVETIGEDLSSRFFSDREAAWADEHANRAVALILLSRYMAKAQVVVPGIWENMSSDVQTINSESPLMGVSRMLFNTICFASQASDGPLELPDMGDALNLLHSRERFSTLIILAGFVDTLGQFGSSEELFEQSLVVLQSVGHISERHRLLCEAATAMFIMGCRNWVIRLFDTVEDDIDRRLLYKDTITYLLADRLFEQALGVIQMFSTTEWAPKNTALVQIGNEMARAGIRDARLWSAILDRIFCEDNNGACDDSFLEIEEAMANAGVDDEALWDRFNLAQSQDPDFRRGNISTAIVLAKNLAKVGLAARAKTLIEGCVQVEGVASLANSECIPLAKCLVENGLPVVAATFLERCLKTTDSTLFIDTQYSSSIAESLLWVNTGTNPMEMVISSLVRKLKKEGEISLDTTFYRVAEALSEMGEHKNALRLLAENVEHKTGIPNSLGLILHHYYRTLSGKESGAILDAAMRIAESIADAGLKAASFAAIALARAKAGKEIDVDLRNRIVDNINSNEMSASCGDRKIEAICDYVEMVYVAGLGADIETAIEIAVDRAKRHQGRDVYRRRISETLARIGRIKHAKTVADDIGDMEERVATLCYLATEGPVGEKNARLKMLCDVCKAVKRHKTPLSHKLKGIRKTDDLDRLFLSLMKDGGMDIDSSELSALDLLSRSTRYGDSHSDRILGMTKASAEECDEQVRGVCLSTVAHAMLEIGEQGRAREIISECLETLDHFSDPDVKVEILCSTASASYKLDDVQTYWECVERAFETCPTIEDRDERDSAYTNIIGVICETEGDVETIESALLRCTKLTSEGCSDALDIIRESLANQDPSKVRRTFTYNPFDLRSAVGAVRSLLVAHAKTDGRDTFDSIAGFCPALRLPFNLAQHS